MQKRIMAMGIVTILLITGFAAVSAGTQVTTSDEDTTLEVTIRYPITMNDQFVDDGATVKLLKIERFDDGGHDITKYSCSFSRNYELYGIRHTEYTRDFLDLDCLLDDDCTYKVVVRKGAYSGSSGEYSANGISNEIKYDDIEITLEYNPIISKASYSTLSTILSKFLENRPFLNLLVESLLR